MPDRSEEAESTIEHLIVELHTAHSAQCTRSKDLKLKLKTRLKNLEPYLKTLNFKENMLEHSIVEM